jgi:hypothetical protein
LIRCLGPYERLGVAVIDIEVAADGSFEFNGAAVSAATDLLLGELCKPAFDLVEPGSPLRTLARW